ncbi:MAG TPA: GlsB/YeaQ/YmgE family stress response membrane protein [Solirubrobacterales bacterium]|nr:GlsB/YeaQ/YmgE family stress response membrane protein [Solirubrobacterales bacterium]
MDVVLFILGLIVMGLIVGALARLLLPGRDPMSLFETMLVGIGGSLVAGLIAYYAFDEEEGAGFFASLICAIAIVYIVRKVRERSV